jgi:hypothetical protein
MRISLLLEREPFGAVLEATLGRFWEERTGRAHRVIWQMGRPNVGKLRNAIGGNASGEGGAQAWLANIYLNAIFVPEAQSMVFDPVRREFARSTVAWRRPAQAAYVALATGPGAAWLAQAGLSVAPAIEGARHQLLVAGNHKLRLLDHRAGVAYGILKQGFDAQFLRRELATRQQAAALGLSVPELKEWTPDGWWFSEAYVSGTPVNRLSDPQAARAATQQACAALGRLLEATLHEEDAGVYAHGLRERVVALAQANRLLGEADRQALDETATALARLAEKDGRIATALGHGDFQAANVLVDDAGFWLIDWEYAARRQAGYDALVCALTARWPHEIAARLDALVNDGPGDDPVGALLRAGRWPGVDWREAGTRRRAAALFLLEELVLHLEENANPCFTRLGAALLTVMSEAAQWAAQEKNR